MKRGLKAGLWLLLGGLLLACTPEQGQKQAGENKAAQVVKPQRVDFAGTWIGNEGLGGNFSLLAHTGKRVHLSDFRGKVVVLIFGFTHCPDVCPTHLLTYAQALKQLSPEEAADVVVLFVSVDPERDRPELLAQYVPAFNPHFIGLTTPDGQTADAFAAMRLFGATAAKQRADQNGFYLVEHSTGTFILNRKGQAVLLEPLGQTATQLAHDLKILLQ